jgi:predicted permease
MLVLTLLFRLATLTLPREERDRYGEEAVETFRAMILERRRRYGALSAWWMGVRGCADMLRAAGMSRRWRREGNRGGVGMWFDVRSDVRLGVRSLSRTPLFTIIALVMLAVGIGASTAIFSVIDAVILQPLPYAGADRLVTVLEGKTSGEQGYMSFSRPNYFDTKARNVVFEEFGAYQGYSLTLTGDGPAAQVQGAAASSGFFGALGVEASLGRSFSAEDEARGAPADIVLISEPLWRTRYGSDPSLVGRTILIDGSARTVVGIMPTDGDWLDGVEVWLPLVDDPIWQRGDRRMVGVARIREGLDLDGVRAGLAPLATQLAEENPTENFDMVFNLIPSSEWGASPELRSGLWILMGAVSLLVLIACLNLTNLLLARGANRRRELAMCAALGAGRGRITRRVWVEVALLCVTGAALGVALAYLGVDALLLLQPDGVDGVTDIAIRPLVLLFAGGATVFAGLISGILPALGTPHDRIAPILREGGSGSVGTRSAGRLRSGLVALETALSVVLLVGAGLLIRSLQEVSAVESGFQTEQRVLFEVGLPEQYQTGDEAWALLKDYLARMQAMPEVRSAAAVSMRPLVGGNANMTILPWDETQESFGALPSADWRLVTPDYFRTMGLELLRGETFGPVMDRDGPMEVILAESLADRLWPGEDPLGKIARLWTETDRQGLVIGVVADMRERGLERDPTPAIYLSYQLTGWTPVHFVAHTRSDPGTLIPRFRSMLAEIDPNLPFSNVQTMDQVVAESTGERRFQTLLLGIFAGAALLLAMAGIYGVINYSVSQRGREIGLRVALGASSDTVQRAVVREGVRPALGGLVVGMGAAFVLSRLMETILFEIPPTDLRTYGGVAVLLLLASVLACWIPARRASRIDPMRVLRTE